MSDARMLELERRLVLAEREVQVTRAQVQALLRAGTARTRRWRRDGLLALAALVAVFAGARALDAQQARPQPLTVRAPFTVVDEHNTPIITVGAPAKGYPRGILLFSDAGHPTAQLTVNTTGDGMLALRRAGQNAFQGETDPNAVGLGIDDQGNGSLFLRNHSQTVVELGSDKAGNGMLRIADMAGKPIVKVQEKGADPRGLLVLNAQAQIAAQATRIRPARVPSKCSRRKGWPSGACSRPNQVEGSR